MRRVLGFGSIVIVLLFVGATPSFSRELTKLIGMGWSQVPTLAGNCNALNLSYSPMDAVQVGVNAVFRKNADDLMIGGYGRYDLNSLITPRLSPWTYFNLYAKVGIYGRFGDKVDAGMTFHAPFIGVELFPFREVEFALSSEWGLIMDLVKPDSFAVGTNVDQLASVGLKLYL